MEIWGKWEAMREMTAKVRDLENTKKGTRKDCTSDARRIIPFIHRITF